MPARNSLDTFSYHQQQQQATDHYTDIETATLARARQKGTKERGKQQASIWSVPEPEKSNKKVKPIYTKVTKDKSNKKADKLVSKEGELTKTFLENPIFENELRNWTLPRVELWCRDPNCSFNQQLWGDHYTSDHPKKSYQPQPHHQQDPQQPLQHSQKFSRGVVLRVNSLPLEDEVFTNRHQQDSHQFDVEKQSTRSKSSSGYQSQPNQYSNQYHSYHNHHQNYTEDNDISINSVPSSMMVLNTHHNNSDHNSTSGASAKGPRHHNRRTHGNMHMNMSMGMGPGGSNNNGSGGGGMNNLSTKKDGSFVPSSKADNNFANSSVIPQQTKGMMTMTQTDTMASSIATHSSNKTNNTDNSLLTVHTGGSGHHSHHHHGGRGDEYLSSDASSGSTFVTGFESSGSATSSIKHSGHDIAEYKSLSRNGHSSSNGYQTAASGGGYPSLPYSQSQGFRTPSASSNPYCPNCSGVVPLSHLDTVTDVSRLKGDPGFWHFNKFQHPLQRDHSFHSVGGFTLNGQYNTNVKKHTMLKFCSSHKISLVVSTFSLLVTIGLLITLFLMKKRGMMDTMDS